MATTEERLETIEKRLAEKKDGSGSSIYGGCALIAFAIFVSGCPRGEDGSSSRPHHVELSIEPFETLKVQLVDRAGKDISLE